MCVFNLAVSPFCRTFATQFKIIFRHLPNYTINSF